MVVDEELLWLLANTSHAIATNLLGILARRMRHGNTLIAADRRRMQEYRFQATIDSLTGLFNRHYLDKIFPRHLARSEAIKVFPWRSGREMQAGVGDT